MRQETEGRAAIQHTDWLYQLINIPLLPSGPCLLFPDKLTFDSGLVVHLDRVTKRKCVPIYRPEKKVLNVQKEKTKKED